MLYTGQLNSIGPSRPDKVFFPDKVFEFYRAQVSYRNPTGNLLSGDNSVHRELSPLSNTWVMAGFAQPYSQSMHTVARWMSPPDTLMMAR